MKNINALSENAKCSQSSAKKSVFKKPSHATVPLRAAWVEWNCRFFSNGRLTNQYHRREPCNPVEDDTSNGNCKTVKKTVNSKKYLFPTS